mgnify:CR=1 FL=1
MATTSNRKTTVTFTVDFVSTQEFSAAANTASPGQEQIVTLASGANTITPPTGGSTVVGCMIIPPAANATLITLKGVTGDTGVPIHKTDHTVVGLDSTLTTFVLTAAAQIIGVRLIWF